MSLTNEHRHQKALSESHSSFVVQKHATRSAQASVQNGSYTSAIQRNERKSIWDDIFYSILTA